MLPSYPILEVSKNLHVFRFLSVGPRGNIPKLIVFTEYNKERKIDVLSLVDLINMKELSDSHLSDNGDVFKILATVAEAIIDYTNCHPDRIIYFAGNDDTGKRNAIYNAAIKRFYLELDFEITGVINQLFCEPFNPATSYQGFFVKRKTDEISL